MKPPELSDEDKALLERMKKARAAGSKRPPGTPVSPELAAKWREPLGGEEGVGMFQPVPAGVPVGVAVLDKADGTTLYRDGRCALEIDIAGKVKLVEPPDGWDARLTSGDATIDLRLERGTVANDREINVIEIGNHHYGVRRRGSAEPVLLFRHSSET